MKKVFHILSSFMIIFWIIFFIYLYSYICDCLPMTFDTQRYSLIDCGEGERLEKLGNRIVRRSCLTATWPKSLDKEVWENYDLRYTGTSGKKGDWELKNPDLKDWRVQFGDMSFCLNNYDMGQIGVFPEQAQNWHFITHSLNGFLTTRPKAKVKVLNLFAYTGGSTIASLMSPQIEVTHVDSSKTSHYMTKINLLASPSQGKVRFILDDCMTFVEREVKRCQTEQDKYDAIILDPPAFGRGSNNKTWKLDKDLPALFKLLPSILSENPAFVLVTGHDLKWTKKKISSELHVHLSKYGNKGRVETGDLILRPQLQGLSPKMGNQLPLGHFVRWVNSALKLKK